MSTSPSNKPGKLAQIAVFAAAASVPMAYSYGYMYVQDNPKAVANISHKLSDALLDKYGGFKFIPNFFPEVQKEEDIPWLGASAPDRNTSKRGMG